MTMNAKCAVEIAPRNPGYASAVVKVLRENALLLITKVAVYLLAVRLGFPPLTLFVILTLETACLGYLFYFSFTRHNAERFEAFNVLAREILSAKRERLQKATPFHTVRHEQSIPQTSQERA